MRTRAATFQASRDSRPAAGIGQEAVAGSKHASIARATGATGKTEARSCSQAGACTEEKNTSEMKASGSSVPYATGRAVSLLGTSTETARPSRKKVTTPSPMVASRYPKAPHTMVTSNMSTPSPMMPPAAAAEVTTTAPNRPAK
jgi:hypothetical protein